ncbi:amino acid adenylation domain-containing protein [Shewanella sp.]|nr:amino acid adenylation domain-containing protein [Shewanella sp.]
MATAYDTLIEANKQGMMLWVENGALKYKASHPKKTAKLLPLLVALKPEIIALLTYNKVHSEDCPQPFIYQTIQAHPPLSFAQERLWFIEQYEQGTHAYHVPRVYQLRPGASIEGIEFALNTIVSRHEILRTTLNKYEDRDEQRVHQQPLNLDSLAVASHDQCLIAIKRAIHIPFDLSTHYPIRATLYHIEPQLSSDAKGAATDTANRDATTLLLINMHHIATDGWSMDCFQREFTLSYAAFIHGHTYPTTLPALSVQYKDYAAWQRAYFHAETLQPQLDFWIDKLQGFQTLHLQYDSSRPAKLTYDGQREYFTLERSTSAALQALSKTQGTTLHVILLSVFSIVLSRYSGQTDIVTGSPIANRHFSQLKDSIGYFANTQVNRIHVRPDSPCQQLFSEVHQDQAAAQQHQDLPFEKLVEQLNIDRDPSRHPIFQVMFGVQSFGHASLKNGTLAPDLDDPLQPREDINQLNDIVPFDLSLFIDCNDACFQATIAYKTALFSPQTIKQFIRHYRYVLKQVLDNPAQPIANLSLLTPCEAKALIKKGQSTTNSVACDVNIAQAFLAQVKRTPHKTALCWQDQHFSFQWLNQKADQLAGYIQSQRPDVFNPTLLATQPVYIGLLLEKGPELIIAMIATLKCGAAYVPMDPALPQSRLAHMITDSDPCLILSQHTTVYASDHRDAQLIDKYQSLANQLSLIDLTEPLYQRSVTPLCAPVECHVTACVIYTSGTTGKPKGVLIDHHNIASLIFSDFFTPTPSDTFLFLSSAVFDAATFEIWTPLLHGGQLVIPTHTPSLLASPEALATLLKQHCVNILWLTKTLFEHLYAIKADLFQSLEYLIVGGEALDKAMINRLISSADKPTHLLNGYGPTESTTFTCVHLIEETISSAHVPIGRPIAGRHCYLLDHQAQPVPVGIVGELYIGGTGLSQGYLNQPQLTKSVFSRHHLAGQTVAEVLYKTGDLACWRHDGTLEYIGRNDRQIKLRGYRIELSEIEQQLHTFPAINQVSVLLNKKVIDHIEDNELVAYYTSDMPLSDADLNLYLCARLPDYMIPSAFIALEHFPLTGNGKLDLHALPKRVLTQYHDDPAPHSPLAQAVSQVYAKVLGCDLDQIHFNANFFAIGGNSLLSIQLKHKLNQITEFKDLSIADLFKFNTVNKLVSSVSSAQGSEIYKQQRPLNNDDHHIAIIGMSCRFSGADDLQALWTLLDTQTEGIHFLSPEEFNELGGDRAKLADDNYIAIATHLRGTQTFDPHFWNMSPNEAKLLDPQIRKFMEHCWATLESAGYITERQSRQIGVFAGNGTDHYFQRNIIPKTDTGEIDLWEASVANRKDALTTKTAYFLGLTGPAVAINTACSTGLVSIAEACRHLQLGTCDMALAGGVSLSMPDDLGYHYFPGMIMARDGHCRPFDQDASGTVPSSGVAVVLLKPLAAAIQDSDEILGVISGYATNNDGDRKTSYTAPSLVGQSECVINAHAMANVTVTDLDYIECHGTATRIGDPIEVQALKEASVHQACTPQPNHTTFLGGIKANIGHTDAASGVAGLIKVLQMLQHQRIVGQTNYRHANDELNLASTPFTIEPENSPWPVNAHRPRQAAISSFGIGGTNAHVVVKEFIPAAVKALNQPQSQRIILLSAKSTTALADYKTALLRYVAQHQSRPDLIHHLAFTLQHKREHHACRSAYVVDSCDSLLRAIKEQPRVSQCQLGSRSHRVFMFPGQGSQYLDMGKNLYDNQADFAEIVDQCIAIANPHLSYDLRHIMFSHPDHQPDEINHTQWTQISLFVIQYSLAMYLQQMHITADAYIGHSIGEYVAATLAGIFTLNDAIKVVIARGQLMQAMPPGKMLAVHARLAEIEPTIAAHQCEVAVINSADDCVLSGSEANVLKLQAHFHAADIPAVYLTTSHAYHSEMMAQAAMQFARVLAPVKLSAPCRPFVTNLTGKMASSNVQTAQYWCDQLRHTVRFADCIDSISQYFDRQVTFIEIGTGQALTSFVNKLASSGQHRHIHAFNTLPSYKENQIHPVTYKADLWAILWMHDQCLAANMATELDATIQPQSAHNLSDCPTYQFEQQQCWIAPSTKPAVNQLALLDKSQWYSAPQWRTCAPLHQRQCQPLFQNALIFIRSAQPREAYAALTAECTFVCVDLNQADYAVVDGVIYLNPANEHHFIQLQTQLSQGLYGEHETIIHAASVDNSHAIEPALHYSFYSLFLTRLYLLNAPQLRHLLILTNHITQISASDPINAHNATLVGAIRNIRHEFGQLNCGILDVGDINAHTSSHILQSVQYPDYYRTHNVYAIKYGKLWQEHYAQIEPDYWQSQAMIADDDTLLITGGMGDVALNIALAISAHHRVNFVLLSRHDITADHAPSEPTKQKLALIDSIIASGCTVITHAVDLGDPNQCNAALWQHIIPTHTITGIIHTAGISPLSPEQYQLENVKKAFAGKVYGLHHLLNSLTLSEVKFLASTSSLASIMGDVNRIEYCAANSYLDYLAMDKARFNRTAVISINWPGWSDLTVTEQRNNDTKRTQEQPHTPDKLRSLMSLNTVRYQEGAAIFYRLIQQQHAQVVVSKLAVDQLEAALFTSPNDIDALSSQHVHIIEPEYSEQEAQVAQLYADVLGVEQLSLTDDFFRIGGNSILAIQLSHQLSQALQRELTVADIFKYRTIKGLLSAAPKVEQIVIPTTADTSVCLSFAQQRLWFIEQYEQGTNAYHIPMLYQLKPGTNVAALKQALQQVVVRHHVLRSVIKQEDNAELAVQTVQDKPLHIGCVTTKNGDSLQAIIRQDKALPFDLSNDYPIRVVLYTLEDGTDSVLLINMHHIATDGWSMDIFHRDLSALYHAQCLQQPASLPALSIQYKDYAQWQRRYLHADVLQQQRDYWLSKLANFSPLALPTDRPRPAHVDYHGGQHTVNLSDELSLRVKALANAQQTTLHTVLLAAFSVLLSKLSNQSDVITGSPIANRHYPQLTDLIGLFINTQVNRLQVQPQLNFKQLIQLTHQDQIAGQQYQDLPFEKLVEELKICRDLSRHPIFQVMFAVQSFGLSHDLNNPLSSDLSNDLSHAHPDRQHDIDTPLKPYDMPSQAQDIARFDLALFVNDSHAALQTHWSYKSSLFNANTIASYAQYFTQLLDSLLQSPSAPLSTHSLLSQDQRRAILDVQQSQFDYPNQSTVCDLFEQQVARSPDNIALVYQQQTLSYRALNAHANALANTLRRRYKAHVGAELEPSTLIPLCVERSLEMVICILAIFKAGGAYVPIDPHYPKARIAYILDDIDAPLVLTQHHLLLEEDKSYHNNPTPRYCARLAIIADLNQPLYREPTQQVKLPSLAATDLAYVIYTSGTTGNPKGVMVTQQSLIYYTTLFIHNINIPKINAAFLLNYCFDASLPTLFSGLLTSGQTTILDSLSQHTSRAFVAALQTHNINTLRLTPSMLMSCKDELMQLSQPLSLVLGGEPINYDAVNALRANNNIQLFNQYGPTECTVGSTIKPITDDIQQQNIGQPYPGKRLYILDPSQQLCAIGQVGELYIGGEGLALGYFNRAALNQQCFIDNPFMSEADQQQGFTRLYKTGDLGRWQCNGDIEYLGRQDDQIKLRGYRIELGEIESQLSTLDGIEQACVNVYQARPNSPRYLVAYYQLHHQSALTDARIVELLAAKLPEYMLPKQFIELDSFALTANGKLDKQALPAPSAPQSDHYVAPRTNAQQQICAIWQELLDINQVGITDDFFRIGGDSILSIQVANRIRQIGLNCQVKHVFEHRTVEQLCQYLHHIDSTITIESEQGRLTGEFGLLPIQQWFVEQINHHNVKNKNHWNQAFLIKVPPLEQEVIRAVITQLIDYHDILRVSYTQQRGQWRQHYQASLDTPKLNVLDVSQHSTQTCNATLTDWQSQFDLHNAPLFQFGYLHGYQDNSARIFVCLHHMLVDTVSWRIIIAHFNTLYHGGQLEPKGTSYRQWSQALANYPAQHPQEAAFWQAQIVDLPNYRQLFNVSHTANTHETHLALSPTLTAALLRTANRRYHTQINDLLLTALAYTLMEVTHCDLHGVTLEGHGREQISDNIDHSHTLGWFTSKFPVRLQLGSNIERSITEIKHQLRQIPNKGIGFGTIACQQQSSFNFNNLPEVSINYLGQFEQDEHDWHRIDEYCGETISSQDNILNIININGMISNGQLRFGIHSKLDKQQAKKFTDIFHTMLTRIILHCCDTKQPTMIYQPQDFKQFIPFETINNDSNKHTIFMLPPGGGGAESFYNNLVPQMGDHKVVLFNNYYDFLNREKGAEATDQLTFEQLALFYIDDIKQQQPKGPYTLAGWSFGGLLAFEISRQLIAHGDEVNHLVLIDAYFNYQKAWEHSNFTDRAQFEHNINYQYQPDPLTLPNTGKRPMTITLFKATQITDSTLDSALHRQHAVRYPIKDNAKGDTKDDEKNYVDNYRSLHRYYVSKVADNHLKQYINQNDIDNINVNIIPMNASHNNWIVQPEVVNKIAHCITTQNENSLSAPTDPNGE